MLILLQHDPGLRGVKRCCQEVSLTDLRRPSIQPQAIALATACCQSIEGRPLPFLWSVSYTHLDVYKRQVEENAVPLAEFLDIPLEKAREIAATDYLFVD